MKPAVPTETPAREAIEGLRQALGQTLAAERRLRGRGHTGTGELSYAQVRSITALHRSGELTAGDLARTTDLGPGSVSAMLDHLEEAGLVQRHRSAEDRRVCHVSLTSEGRALAECKLARWQALWEEALGEFSDEEVENAARVLRRVTGIFDSVYARTAPP